MSINKALYGLCTSGLIWHEIFVDCLREMIFPPYKAESDIWIRPNNQCYDYIAVYVNDLVIALLCPQDIIDVLTTKYMFKLKGTGPLTHNLGMDFKRDKNGILCMSSTTYIDKISQSYKLIFGSSLNQKYLSPLEYNDHP